MSKTITGDTGQRHPELEESYTSFALRHKRQYETFVKMYPLVLAKLATDDGDHFTYAPGAREMKPSANNYLIHEEVKYPFDTIVGAGKEVSTDP